MSTSQIQAVTAEELFAMLQAVDGLEHRGAQDRAFTYYCWDDQKVIAQAQQVLLSCGYELVVWRMIEDNTYVFGYIPMDSIYPSINHMPHIELRLFINAVSEPPLVLVYHDDRDDRWRLFEDPPRLIHGTTTYAALMLQREFGEAHPFQSSRWLPFLDGLWPFPG